MSILHIIWQGKLEVPYTQTLFIKRIFDVEHLSFCVLRVRKDLAGKSVSQRIRKRAVRKRRHTRSRILSNL